MGVSPAKSVKSHVAYALGPLFKERRWIWWVVCFIAIGAIFGNQIIAATMHIPQKEELIKVRGILVNTALGWQRDSAYIIGIQDESGAIHQCSCTPLGRGNCLGLKKEDYDVIIDELDAEALKKYAPLKAVIYWMADKSGEIYMYPKWGSATITKTCYEIYVGGVELLNYNTMAARYAEYKESFSVRFVKVLLAVWLLAIVAYVVVRIGRYDWSGDHAQGG